jgi:hypothetical protein
MSCCQPTNEQIELLRTLSHCESEFENLDNAVNLPRGGVIVKTKIGNIQIGMPPETIKDSMGKVGVPNIFIVPTRRYSKEFFINVAEFEFPAYFNFFVSKKRIKLVCTPEQELVIRIIFQETLLGPTEFPVKTVD